MQRDTVPFCANRPYLHVRCDPFRPRNENVGPSLNEQPIKRRLERLGDRFEAGDPTLSRETYLERLGELKAELARAARVGDGHVTLDAMRYVKDFTLLYTNRTPEKRRELWRFLFKRLVLKDKQLVRVRPHELLMPLFAATLQQRSRPESRSRVWTTLRPGSGIDVIVMLQIAGRSRELEALAAYLQTLRLRPSSSSREDQAADRGRKLFTELGCAECHAAPAYTDGLLHDVGTGDPDKERNSHGRGTRFDTPALRSLWLTAPYFHDGSAGSLRDVLSAGTAHNVAGGLSEQEIDDLVRYLLSLP